jgi:hypothetical protein
MPKLVIAKGPTVLACLIAARRLLGLKGTSVAMRNDEGTLHRITLSSGDVVECDCHRHGRVEAVLAGEV